jgi:hypothetical protein
MNPLALIGDSCALHASVLHPRFPTLSFALSAASSLTNDNLDVIDRNIGQRASPRVSDDNKRRCADRIPLHVEILSTLSTEKSTTEEIPSENRTTIPTWVFRRASP